MAALVATALWQIGRAPVTIVGARRTSASNRVTLDIRNDAPDRVRLYAVDLLARMGTNWVFVGNVPLGFTNCTERCISIDVDFPERPRPWKARLTYMPAFSRTKLLRWRLAQRASARALGLLVGRVNGTLTAQKSRNEPEKSIWRTAAGRFSRGFEMPLKNLLIHHVRRDLGIRILELAARLTANELDDIYCLVATGDLYVDLEKSLLSGQPRWRFCSCQMCSV